MNEKTIYALGFFDGVHLGHQVLLQACCQLAAHTGCRAGAVTFSAHPESLISGQPPLLINTVEDRQRLLREFGMTEVLVLPFDEKLRKQPWQDFLEDLLDRGAVGFICGDDFRFGFRGQGNAQLLADFCRERDLYWSVIPAQTLDDTRVSSTHIRRLLEQGEMAEAIRFLKHPHVLTGTVVAGRHIGTTMGIPTANLELPEGIVCPRHGVYACKAIVDGKQYLAVTNIGNRPTVGGHHVTVEPWLLDFTGDLYGKALTLQFHAFLRPEQKFPSLEALRAEIRKNAEETRKILGNS